MDLATLQKTHPEWNLVDYKVASNGGLWALGKDGGVFALDATGGTTGLTAPAIPGGSYTALPAEQRQGNRTFTRLDVNQSGGYTLVSSNQEHYNFNGPAPAAPVAAPATDTAGTTQATDTSLTNTAGDVTGSGAIHAVLDPLGLGGLADQALAALHGTPGADASYITTVWLPQQDTFKKAFPEIAATQEQVAKGFATHIPTPAEILTYRQTAKTLADQGIIPPEFVTDDKIGKLITGGVSVTEFQNRVLQGVDALTNADPATKAAFMAYHPAVDFSHAVGAFLDPNTSMEAIGRTIAQAQVGGAARRAGYGNVTADEATGLAAAGQGTQAQFTNLALEQPLFQNLAGETGTITHGEQLGTLTGNAANIAEIERRRAQRQATFQGGGGAASGGTGNQGLGAAK
jgi:hypothetical protein